ncbi:MAG: hypothetical protein EAZ76_15865 [Nostocales cyanobacterium]|nr:MAG: hypothetical protein EAZ87_09710 [Nostocales cyanobacterium]TAF10088.1 MAG: hypothetical protein EAZ76_15865 [Nostocales cyanobacterium]
MTNLLERYKQAIEKLKIEEEAINKLAQDYSQLQINVIIGTIDNFAEFVRSTGRLCSQSEKLILDSLEFSLTPIQNSEVPAGKIEEFTDYVKAGIKAAKYGGLPMLAWLGGGSLAAGGGGIVLGAAILGGVAIIPALIIAQNSIKVDAECEAQIKQITSDIYIALDYINQIREKINNLYKELESINNLAIKSFNELKAKPFNAKRDVEKFRQTGTLIKGLVEILKTPVLNSDRQLNIGTVTIIEKYRILPGK